MSHEARDKSQENAIAREQNLGVSPNETSNDIAIKVTNVSKSFKLPHDKQNSIKGGLISLVKNGKRTYEKQEVLKDISFEIKKGEFFGIVGKNGGGKSTLLKIISGIYTPSAGSIQVNGSLTPFIELGVGFNPELTGRENVYLNGALLGFKRKQMDAMYDDIVGFAELERFMDQKLKNYSSGMQVRLAFSIAIRAESDILVMDEVLAVGDAAFQKKCFEIFRELKKQGRTIILVTHDMANVERFCDRALVIDKGKQLTISTPGEASSMYSKLNIDEKEMARKDLTSQKKTRLGGGQVRVSKIKLVGATDGNSTFEFGKPLKIIISIEREASYEGKPFQIGFAIFNEDNVVIAGPNNINKKLDPAANKISCTIPNLNFKPGEYSITVAIYDKDGIDRLDYLEKWLSFSVVANHMVAGVIEVESSWEAL